MCLSSCEKMSSDRSKMPADDRYLAQARHGILARWCSTDDRLSSSSLSAASSAGRKNPPCGFVFHIPLRVNQGVCYPHLQMGRLRYTERKGFNQRHTILPPLELPNLSLLIVDQTSGHDFIPSPPVCTFLFFLILQEAISRGHGPGQALGWLWDFSLHDSLLKGKGDLANVLRICEREKVG